MCIIGFNVYPAPQHSGTDKPYRHKNSTLTTSEIYSVRKTILAKVRFKLTLKNGNRSILQDLKLGLRDDPYLAWIEHMSFRIYSIQLRPALPHSNLSIYFFPLLKDSGLPKITYLKCEQGEPSSLTPTGKTSNLDYWTQ